MWWWGALKVALWILFAAIIMMLLASYMQSWYNSCVSDSLDKMMGSSFSSSREPPPQRMVEVDNVIASPAPSDHLDAGYISDDD